MGNFVYNIARSLHFSKDGWRSLFIVIIFMNHIPNFAMADGVSDAYNFYGKCLDEGRGDNDTFDRCYGKYLKSLEDELTKLWRGFLEQHEAKRKRIFNNSDDAENDTSMLSYIKEEHKKWESYKDSSCMHLRDVMVYGTSGPYIRFPNCRVHVIKQRIELLRKMFCEGESLEDCKVPQ